MGMGRRTHGPAAAAPARGRRGRRNVVAARRFEAREAREAQVLRFASSFARATIRRHSLRMIVRYGGGGSGSQVVCSGG